MTISNFTLYFSIFMILLIFILAYLELGISGIIKLLKTPKEKSRYHLITFQRFSNSPESIFYEGNIATFILIEREMGRNTTLLNVLEVTEEDYNKSKHLDKKLERMKKNAIG